ESHAVAMEDEPPVDAATLDASDEAGVAATSAVSAAGVTAPSTVGSGSDSNSVVVHDASDESRESSASSDTVEHGVFNTESISSPIPSSPQSMSKPSDAADADDVLAELAVTKDRLVTVDVVDESPEVAMLASQDSFHRWRMSVVEAEVPLQIVLPVGAIEGLQPTSHVQLAGSFTDWKPCVSMQYDAEADGFVANVSLIPAVYKYRFLVDGDWKVRSDIPVLRVADHTGTLQRSLVMVVTLRHVLRMLILPHCCCHAKLQKRTC
ncbi:MAG: hypothetical protein EOO65_03820, partial [Methanosarcinales archaeon]